MKTKYSNLLLVFFLSLAVGACSTDEKIAEEENLINTIIVNDIENNIINLAMADEYALSLTLSPEDADDIEGHSFEFASSNSNIFTVTDEGVITAKNTGEASLRISSTSNSDLWAIVIVNVSSKVFPVESIQIDENYQDFHIAPGESLNLTPFITISPSNATDKELVYTSSNTDVASITRRGVLTTQAPGDITLTIASDDGTNITKTINVKVRNTSYQNIARDLWSVSTSHDYYPDGAVIGTPGSLIDDPNSGSETCLCLVKPGKTLGDITVGASEEVFFVIDLGQEKEFCAFTLRHRVGITSANLRLTKASTYGSNNGIAYSLIDKDLAVVTNINEPTIALSQTVKYRYFKLVFAGWNTNGNTVQISDFNIAKLVYEEL